MIGALCIEHVFSDGWQWPGYPAEPEGTRVIRFEEREDGLYSITYERMSGHFWQKVSETRDRKW